MMSRILLVDDEESIRRSLGEILEIEGYDVVAADSGEAAIERLQEASFDLVLLDIKMPGMGGLEVLHYVRSMTPDIKVILLTAHGSLESAIQALREGAQDYILKPASPRSILDSIGRALAARSEAQHRRQLLDELDQSVQRLKNAEGMEKAVAQEPDFLALGNGVMFDMARREIRKGSQSISLTPTEGRLMKVFFENRGGVLSHKDLVLKVQGFEPKEWEAAEVLRPIISRLRRKLSGIEGGEKWIVNVRGTGYVFDAE